MRERKTIHRALTFEETHRREKRLARRENTEDAQGIRKQRRGETAERKRTAELEAGRILSEDRKKPKPDKKPDLERFLTAFSFIERGVSPHDKRHEAPANYRPRSFNINRQYTDFMKAFVYPHNVPQVLLISAIRDEYCTDKSGQRVKSPDYDSIMLSRKWVRDIVSGQSFYQRNKDCFTKAESHFFLNTEFSYSGMVSNIFELYFHAKCAARKMGEKLCGIIAKVFSIKFAKYFDHAAVTGFLDFLARNAEYRTEQGELGDICDFILDKVFEGRDRTTYFSFSGRTMTSVIALANEWHAQIQREQELLQAQERERQRNDYRRFSEKKRWKGLPIASFRHETETGIWMVRQLLSVQELLNEGREMKNCVASYAYRCFRDECYIFNVSLLTSGAEGPASHATLEVSPKHELVQAKGKCNSPVLGKTRNVISRWAQANRIKVSLF